MDGYQGVYKRDKKPQKFIGWDGCILVKKLKFTIGGKMQPMDFVVDESELSFMSYPGNIRVEESDRIQYILCKFKPGKYKLVGLDQVRGNLISRWSHSFTFNVYPRKVTYIGSFNLTVEPGKKGTEELIGVYNEFKRDLPKFLRRYKNIPANKYRIGLAKKSSN